MLPFTLSSKGTNRRSSFYSNNTLSQCMMSHTVKNKNIFKNMLSLIFPKLRTFWAQNSPKKAVSWQVCLHISLSLKPHWSACSNCLQHLNLERFGRKLIPMKDVSRKIFWGSGGTWTQVSQLQVCHSINSATRFYECNEALFNIWGNSG